MKTDRYGWLRVLAYLCLLFFGMLSVSAQGQTHSYCPTDGVCTWTAAQTVTISNAPLVFTPFSHVNGFSSIIGAGPHNGGANTPLGWYQTMAGSGKLGAEAGTFAISIPSNYNGPVGVGNVVDALGFYGWTQDAGHYAIGLSGQMVCDATGGFCWAANPQVIVYGANGATGMQVHGVETDCSNRATGTILYCNQVGGPGSTVNPTTSIGYDVSAPTWPSGKWDAGLQLETGAATYAVYASPLASGNSQQSIPFGMQGTSSGGAAKVGQMAVDSNGDIFFNLPSGGFIRNSTAGSGYQLLSSGGFFTQLTNTATAFRSIIFPDAGGNVVLDTATQTLTNKTLTTPVISSITNTGTLTLPTATGTLANVIASGTSTFTTTAVGAGACQTTVTTAATNALTTDTISWAYATAPTAATDGVLHILPYVTANNVNFMRCNASAGSITPTALVINWKVIR